MKQKVGINTKKVESKSKDSTAVKPKEGYSRSIDSSGEQILGLQRTIGNLAVQKLMKSGTIQAKLKVDKPGDKYEQEADRIAGKIINMKELGGVREEGEQVQAKHADSLTPGVSSKVESSINSLSGGGQALAESTRAFFESRFNKDFSQVRVHTNSQAAKTAKSLNARAFTTGRDVVFGEGEYSPGTSSGKRLLAHELSHVIQQRSSKLVQRTPDHKVVKGDTLYSLAKKYGVSVDDLKKANGLTSDTIKEGQVLKIPSSRPATHKVVKGDTLYSLAKKFGVSVDDLKKANGLTSDTIPEGQVLKIPSSRPATHKVVKGDTLYSLAKKYGVSVDELKKANGLTSDKIQEGQVLNLPSVTGSAPAVPTPPVLASPGSPGLKPIKPPSKPPPPKPATPGPSGLKPIKPPATPPPPPSKSSSPATSTAPTSYPGHPPGGDYKKGEILERSFLRKSNKSSIQKYKGNSIFFKKGQQVELISESGFWIEVKGHAYYDKKSPKQVMKTVGKGSSQPEIRTGWIKRKWTDMSKGKYQHLAIEDRTPETGELGYKTHIPKANVKNIILHQTGVSTASSTLNTYKSNIRKGSHLGAHYLIGRDGKIYLTVPVNRKVAHISPDIKGKTHITNTVSLGIEHVGSAHSITPNTKKYNSKAWKTEMKRVRADVKALDLSPAYKAKLLALSNRNLYNKLKWSGWKVYGDITGAQKRATYLLTQRMMKDFGLTINDLVAHEEAQKKTTGEGENIKEFLLAMHEYPRKVQALRTLANSNKTLSGLTDFMKIVTHEESLVKAIQLDATRKENEDLAKEKAGKTNGPATKRETMRVSFYKDFYKRMKQLTEMIAFLKSKGTSDMTALKSKIAAWRK